MAVNGEAYKTCDELPLFNWIELCVSGDTKWLIKSGQPDGLDKIAEDIQSEYAELSGDKSVGKALRLSIQITYLTTKLDNLCFIISHLRNRRIDGLVKLLQAPAPEGFGFRYSYTDLQGDLDRTETASKSDRIKLSKAIADYEAIPKSEKATKKQWYEKLSQIAKYRQVPSLNPHQLTLMEFIMMDNDFNSYVSYLKNEKERKNRN